MKKTLLAAVVAVIALAGAQAERMVAHTVHLAVPVTAQWLEGGDGWGWADDWFADIDKHYRIGLLGFDADWSRTTINDNGFSFVLNVGVGAAFAHKSGLFVNTLSGQQGMVKCGWGYAPLRSEKMVLAVHGFVALDLRTLDGRASATVDGIRCKAEDDLFSFSNSIGVDVAFFIRLGQSFGLTAGLDISTNLFGWYTHDRTMQAESSGVTYPWDDVGCTSYTVSFDSISVIPRLGICWLVD